MRLPLILAAIVQIQPIVSEDVLEPSVRNEVDHALSLAAAAMSTNSPAAAASTPSPIAIAAPTNAIAAASAPSPIAIAAPTNAIAAATISPSPAVQPTNSPAAPSPITAAPTNAFAFVAAPTNAPPSDIFGTNGLSATAIAIKLVSSQRADGRWFSGTNDVTDAAIQILLSL